MGSTGGRKRDDDEYSYISEKPELGFIDHEDDISEFTYNPVEEGPIIISVPFPFVKGKPQSIAAGDIAVDSVTLQNTTDEAVDLWARVYSSNPEDSFTLSLTNPQTENPENFLEFFELEDRMLQPGEVLTVWVSCKPKEIGMHTTALTFDLGSDSIERVVFLLAEDKISMSLMSEKPYSKGLKKKQFPVDGGYVAGGRVMMRNDRPIKNRLPLHDIPGDIRDMAESKQIPEVVYGGLTKEKYVPFFKTLLVMEEIRLEQDMRNHNMERVTMRKIGSYLSLVVPGLAERRPSLVKGDHIFVKIVNKNGKEMSSSPYQGYIHSVKADAIFLKFSLEFHLHHLDRTLYNVQFVYNRINMRRLYQAVEDAKNLEIDFLFPSESDDDKRVIETTPLVPISFLLNEEQMRSVEMILGCKGGAPYLIYGPPGTGKSMTLIETILQLYKTRTDTKMLVCAPSNSAADHLLEKLLSEETVRINEREILRLNAAARQFEDIKPEFIQFCSFEDSIFICPPVSALAQYKIIVSTYMSCALLNAEGVKRGNFSHIFLDEAGQASEPESMVPISNLCCKDTVVVLAGDTMQLGPVIFSKEADNHGFGKSYLERLFESEYYNSGDENYMTKLVRNYRSHQEILHLPSELFYNGELIAAKDDRSSFIDSVSFLPDKEFPVLFYGIQGCDEREGSNPSWFNRIEASKVVKLLQELLGGGKLTGKDIGVITPYRQQVLKIKKALESLDLSDVSVGSVEQFQGQERQVIIISTVRSTVKHNEFDRAHCLGFLSNPRRFNVAITRAIALLVVIGNPHIICKDTYWNQLLWRCVDNNSYKGCILPERKEVTNEEDPGQQEYPYYEENPQPNGAGEWGQDNFEPPPSGGGDWDQEPFEPQPTGGEWDQKPFEPQPTGGEWDQEMYTEPNPAIGGDHHQEYFEPQPSGGWERDQQYSNKGDWK